MFAFHKQIRFTTLYIVCQIILYLCLIWVQLRYPYSILTDRYCNLILKSGLYYSLFDTKKIVLLLIQHMSKNSIYMEQVLKDNACHENHASKILVMIKVKKGLLSFQNSNRCILSYFICSVN